MELATHTAAWIEDHKRRECPGAHACPYPRGWWPDPHPQARGSRPGPAPGPGPRPGRVSRSGRGGTAAHAEATAATGRRGEGRTRAYMSGEWHRPSVGAHGSIGLSTGRWEERRVAMGRTAERRRGKMVFQKQRNMVMHNGILGRWREERESRGRERRRRRGGGCAGHGGCSGGGAIVGVVFTIIGHHHLSSRSCSTSKRS